MESRVAPMNTPDWVWPEGKNKVFCQNKIKKMPSHTETKTIPEQSSSSLQTMAYRCFESLGWKVELAAENLLVGYTRQTWNRYSNEVTVETGDGSLTVTSKMIHGEIMDAFGRTKKDVADFFSAFENCLTSDKNEDTVLQEKIQQLKEGTVEKVKEEVGVAVETEKAMNLVNGNSYLTYLLIGINLLLFIAMVAGGTDLMNPTADDIVNWGGNIAGLTSGGEWWRIISNIFIHIGILHLLFNMYGLFYIGRILEPMLGKPLFISSYLFTGIVASLLSLWWHQDEKLVSAGASGAIFGMFGLFLSLLLTDLIPKTVRHAMLQSTAVFVGYNLIYGLRGGVDNAAHIGGLAGGFIIGFPVYQLVLKKKETGNKIKLAAGMLLLATISIYFGISAVHNAPNYVSKSTEERYNEIVKEFSQLETEALEVYEKSNSLTKEEYIRQLKGITLENWKKGESLARELGSLKLDERAAKLQSELVTYCSLNTKKAELTIKIFSELSQEYNDELNKTEDDIEACLIRIQKMADQND